MPSESTQIKSFWSRSQHLWQAGAKGATGLIAIVGTFVAEPPIQQLVDSQSMLPGIAKFLITVLVLVIFILSVRSGNGYLWRWLTSMLLSLVLSIALLTAFLWFHSEWTCPYGGQRWVIGWELTNDAKQYVTNEKRGLSNSDLIGDYTTARINDIWPAEAIRWRVIKLAGLYLSTLAFFCITVLSAVQCVFAGIQRKGARRSRGVQ